MRVRPPPHAGAGSYTLLRVFGRAEREVLFDGSYTVVLFDQGDGLLKKVLVG